VDDLPMVDRPYGVRSPCDYARVCTSCNGVNDHVEKVHDWFGNQCQRYHEIDWDNYGDA
jgi:hypothetical protein